MWSTAASNVQPMEQAAFGICGPNVGSLTRAHKGRKMLDGFLVPLSMKKKREISSMTGHDLTGWRCELTCRR